MHDFWGGKTLYNFQTLHHICDMWQASKPHASTHTSEWCLLKVRWHLEGPTKGQKFVHIKSVQIFCLQTSGTDVCRRLSQTSAASHSKWLI